MTCGAEAYAYAGGPGPQCSGGHLHEDWGVIQAVDPDTGLDVPDGQWGNLVVTTLDRDNGLLRYDLEEAVIDLQRAVPVRRDDEAGLLGRPLQGLPDRAGPVVQHQRGRAGAAHGRRR